MIAIDAEQVHQQATVDRAVRRTSGSIIAIHIDMGATARQGQERDRNRFQRTRHDHLLEPSHRNPAH